MEWLKVDFVSDGKSRDPPWPPLTKGGEWQGAKEVKETGTKPACKRRRSESKCRIKRRSADGFTTSSSLRNVFHGSAGVTTCRNKPSAGAIRRG
jgi:hypothetical protein